MGSRWGWSAPVAKAPAGPLGRYRRVLRAFATIAASVMVLSMSAGAASATVPATLSGNAKPIAELAYRNWFPRYTPEVAYPRCHVVCRRLWDAEQALSPSSGTAQEILRELMLLTKRTGTSTGFYNYSHNLVASGTDYYVGGRLAGQLEWTELRDIARGQDPRRVSGRAHDRHHDRASGSPPEDHEQQHRRGRGARCADMGLGTQRRVMERSDGSKMRRRRNRRAAAARPRFRASFSRRVLLSLPPG